MVIRQYKKLQEKRMARQYEQGPQGSNEEIEDTPRGKKRKVPFLSPAGPVLTKSRKTQAGGRVLTRVQHPAKEVQATEFRG